MNEVALFGEKTVTTKELAEEVKRVLLKSGNHLDFIFSESYEQESMKKLCSTLKYYYLEKSSFFIKVQPYFSILAEIKRNNNKNGYVYFIKDMLNDFIKIGRTKNVKKRVSQLSSSNNSLKILKVIKSNNAPVWERELHKFYKEKKQYKEWFSLDEADIKSGIIYLEDKFNTEIDPAVMPDAE